MEIILSQISKKPTQTVIKVFSTLKESKLELIGNFNTFIGHEPLSCLSRQVNTVHLKGQYNYKEIKRKVPFERDSWSTETGLKIYLGQCLKNYVASLPNTVHKLSFEFSYPKEVFNYIYEFYNYHFDGITEAVKVIPNSIKYLDLSGMNLSNMPLADIRSLLGRIPITVHTIYLTLSSGPKMARALEALPSHITSIYLDKSKNFGPLDTMKKSVAHLSLANTGLHERTEQDILALIDSLPKNLKRLDLGNNKLWKRDKAFWLALLAHLPPGLEWLGLGDNDFLKTNLSPEDIIHILNSIPDSVIELDVSNNSFLFLRDIYWRFILQALPQTVRSINLSEKSINLSAYELRARFRDIPPQIETFILTGSGLLHRRVRDILIALSGLPETVNTLDLSSTHLDKLSTHALAQLLADLPYPIKKIKLNNNDLANLPLTALEEVFRTLAETIVEVDFSDNGFDNYYPTQFEELLNIIPARIKRLTFDAKRFGIRNDGALIPAPFAVSSMNLKKPEQAIIQRKEFTNLRLVLWQIMVQNNLHYDVMFHIFSYLFSPSTLERQDMENQFMLQIIPATPPHELTLEIQEESIMAAQERINALEPGAKHLDLSHCGLNRLNEKDMFRYLFSKLPDSVTSISFRGNGFQYDQYTLDYLMMALGEIPEDIKHVDLSAHGFEFYDANQLRELLSNLPATVELVSLSHEKPLSPAEQIAKRMWPNSYNQLTEKTQDVMQQARTLLNDYTKGNSAMKRFFHGHWNRHHIDAVATLVIRIDNGLITNMKDLLHEFNQIPMSNETGSLARRLAFLLHQESKAKYFIEEQEIHETFEMEHYARLPALSNNIIELEDVEKLEEPLNEEDSFSSNFNLG